MTSDESPAGASRRAYAEQERRGEERARLEQQVTMLQNRIVALQLSVGRGNDDASRKVSEELASAREDLRSAWERMKSSSDAEWAAAKRSMVNAFDGVKKCIDDIALRQQR